MADIFLSYAREDREKAERLAKALEGQGWSVWWDTRLSAGDIWDELIERELHASRAVVVLWSRLSIKRRWVKREARYGDRKRMLFPAFIEAVDPPLEFSDVQGEDLVRWRGGSSHSGYSSLSDALRARLKRPPQEEPPEAEQEARRKPEREPAGDGPRLSSGLQLVSYEAVPFGARESPHAAEIRFSTRRPTQPARFRVVCEGTIHSATSVLEIFEDGTAVDAFSYYESTRVVSHNVVMVEVSDRPIEPRNQFYIQVRSSAPIHMRKVEGVDATGAQGEGFSPKDLGVESKAGRASLSNDHGFPEVRDPRPGPTGVEPATSPRRTPRPHRREKDEESNRQILIPGGEFLMGSPEGVGHDNEHPQHLVRLSPFYLQEHPVTNEEFRRLDAVHSYVQGDERHPVVHVSWGRALAYAKWLGGRLPTEAEWEYACRAGTETAYWSGDSDQDLERVGWYRSNARGHTHPVGGKAASPMGLHDMHGNVWEWVADWYGRYPEGPQVNPLLTDSASDGRVVRGGSYVAKSVDARSATRIWIVPHYERRFLGFRVAFDAAPSKGD